MNEQPTKYLIVSAGWSDYDREIRRRHLPPGQCFQFTSTAEAYETRWHNAQWGIACEVIWTAAFDAASPIGRRTS